MEHAQLIASCRYIMRITAVEPLSVLFMINLEYYVNSELAMYIGGNEEVTYVGVNVCRYICILCIVCTLVL